MAGPMMRDEHGGIFTISLDFELYWGMRDVVSIEGYREHLEGTQASVLAMLEAFERYGIHATWAIVGFVFFEDRDALMRALPDERPAYTTPIFDLYRYLSETERLERRYHFAPELIAKIAQTPGQEIATHSFSHYYCLEEGQDAETFEADIAKAVETIAHTTGRRTESIVFPRNQYNSDYMPILSQYGIRAFRGNEKHPVYDAVDWEGRGWRRRGVKLLDTYLNLTGYHTYRVESLERVEGVLDIPASRFLRPYKRISAPLERLKLRRIKRAMTHAAKRGEIYHLWWHPHNFGKDLDANIAFLGQILEHFSYLQQAYGMQALSMDEIEKLACRITAE